MKLANTVAGIALAAGILSSSSLAIADKPADDYLNPQDPGPRLSFMTIFGPGFRAVYDHRYELEQDVTELRTQVIGDAVFPYSEISANIDLRMFLFTIGGTVGYHNEWRLLQFRPDYDEDTAGRSLGRDLAGQRQSLGPPEDGRPVIGPFGFDDLSLDARRVKDQSADAQTGRWPFYEGRIGFLWPGQNFMGVSTAAIRIEDRPDVSFDWANSTVLNGGWHLRWETYWLFRHREIGFLGPALRVMNVPRNRLQQGLTWTDQQLVEHTTAASGAACQQEAGVPCEQVRETDFHYGLVGGFRPNWVGSSDVFLTRIYMTYGLNDELFGTHIFGMPMSILFAYQVDFAL